MKEVVRAGAEGGAAPLLRCRDEKTDPDCLFPNQVTADLSIPASQRITGWTFPRQSETVLATGGEASTQASPVEDRQGKRTDRSGH